MTFFFLFIIIGTTSKGAATGFAGIPIGLALTLIHLVSIPVTNTSVNPARSTGPALFAGGAYVGQLWLFWLAPIVGAVIAGLLTRWMYEQEAIIDTVVVEERRVTPLGSMGTMGTGLRRCDTVLGRIPNSSRSPRRESQSGQRRCSQNHSSGRLRIHASNV